eukprot:TRINITY_DN40191_c0_g1_i1.p1 TRINITY_DN40191_c0_g1~~TRINITY_DN40191_c0_g1_i1.p1  ORF type:complete len:202 (-),score=33.38 TRINITY_DN40191_c0_g1_i1:120-725(-)
MMSSAQAEFESQPLVKATVSPPMSSARRHFTQAVPIFGPLCGCNVVPTFEDVDKLLQVLALVQGLLLSCFAGDLFADKDFGDHMAEAEVRASLHLHFAFQCEALALLFTLVLYAYIVFLLRQEDNHEVAIDLADFWGSGGRFIVTLLVVLTVTGACFYASAVATAFRALHPELSIPFLLPLTALGGVFLIHISFMPKLRKL